MTRLYKLLLWAPLLVGLSVQALEFGTVAIQIGKQELTLELAETPQQRSRGLMYRETLCEDCGMLFVYSQPRPLSMWMKNTLIPLDVAFADKDGRILVIKSMQPHDLTPVGTEQPATYAWEMNQGWFEANQVKVGDVFKVLSQ
ncbi:DUF192 domain-containing protein [Lacimicrobium sp. SS2-24]|uniref:DUF192 domain-containing protein n=1 Tax=Lacimicrobium sp. SS2-24 TaxID=2005569 RepID=UPI000B4B2BEA|nr:DUF192 domain-containing protein [Lacimicrobium sp. SS2-24]